MYAQVRFLKARCFLEKGYLKGLSPLIVPNGQETAPVPNTRFVSNYVHLLRLLQTFAGVLQKKKIRTRAFFKRKVIKCRIR